MQGHLAQEHPPSPQDPLGTLGAGLRQGPRGMRFLISEFSLYAGLLQDRKDRKDTGRHSHDGGVERASAVISVSQLQALVASPKRRGYWYGGMYEALGQLGQNELGWV